MEYFFFFTQVEIMQTILIFPTIEKGLSCDRAETFTLAYDYPRVYNRTPLITAEGKGGEILLD